MRNPSSLPAALRTSGFTVRAAGDAGVSRQRLRAADLDSPFHRVRRSSGTSSSAISDARALATTLLSDQCCSHQSAALLHGLRTPGRWDGEPPHVAVRKPGRAPRIRGAHGHVLPADARIVEVDGIRVTDPIDTWISLAQVCTVDELLLIGDGLVGGRSPLLGIDDLRARLRERKGATGIRKLRTAVGLVRERTDSAKETELRLLLLRLGFREPEVNGAILDRDGSLIAHGDLVFRAERVIVEYDGDHHRTDRRQWAIDIRRLNQLADEGWRVIRVDADLLRRPAALCALLRRALAA